jgi:pSer/pThr/pTyr-binding forkhead associated (FHA) protein
MGGQIGPNGPQASAAPAPAVAAAPATAAPPQRCPRCGGDNARNMQFCRTCGFDLHAAAAVGAARIPIAGAPGGQPGVSSRAPQQSAAVPAGSVLPCRRCGGQNDAATRCCKFCGSPFEGGSAASPQAAEDRPPAARTPVADGASGHELRGQVVVIHRDGSEGGVYTLEGTQSDIGSREGDIVLPEDPYLSPRHARVERRGDTFVLRDLDSANGIYMRLREPAELVSGDMFLIGQQVLRFEVLPESERRVGPAKQHGVMVFGTPELPRLARITQYTTEGLPRDVHYLYRDETVFGREQADVVFAEDPFLSRRHAAISMDRDNMRFGLRDLGSSNGTAIRFRGERPLHNGDQFRLGRHLFRFDLTAGGRGGRNP